MKRRNAMRLGRWLRVERPESRRRSRPVLESLEPRVVLSTATITEYPTPDSFGLGPENLALAPDGSVWFPELSGDALGEFDPSTDSVTNFPLPSTNTSVGSITFGPNGNLWFVNDDGGTPQISEFDPATSAITNFPLTAGAISLAAGNDGNLWFSSDEEGLGTINPSTGAISIDKFPAGFSATAISSGPMDVRLYNVFGNASGPDAMGIYFTDGPNNSVGYQAINESFLTEAGLSTPGADPNDVSVTPDGNIWYTENGVNKIGEMNPGTGVRTEFTLPSSVTNLLALVASPTGDIWFTTYDHGEVGELVPANGDVTIYNVPDAPAAELTGIATDPVGDLWFLDNEYGVGQVVPQPIVATQLVTLMPAPSNVVVGQPFTFTVAATDSLDEIDTFYNGTITVSLPSGVDGQTLGGTLTATAVHGIATFTGLSFSQVTDGQTLSVTATGLSSTTIPAITVGQDSTTTSLSASPSSTGVGQSVTLTSTVAISSPGAGVVTGSVSFFDSGNLLGTSPLALVNGVPTATYTATFATAGTHSISATYSGDADNQASNSSYSDVSIVPQATITTLTDSLAGTPAAPILTLTATVAPAVAAADDPTGQVSFMDGTQTLGTGTLATDADGTTSASITLDSPAVGSYVITADYLGDSSNTASSSTPLNVTIAAATATLAFGSLAFTYTGAGQGTTVTTSPAGLSGVTISYTQRGVAIASPTLAGSYDVTASLNNARYVAEPITGTLVISAAAPTIEWSAPDPITYGTALGGTQLDATASVTVGGVNVNVPGTFVYLQPTGTVLNAGQNQTLSVSFTPFDTNDYTGASGQTDISVAAAMPQVDWPSPAAITYGTPLTSTQLDATASWLVGGTSVNVPGTFDYGQFFGKVFYAGLNQELSVQFTPSDTKDFVGTSGQTTINVDPATPFLTWPRPAAITFGTALSSAQLDATASYGVAGFTVSVPGTFVYGESVGTILNAAQNESLSVSFYPTDTTDYVNATGFTTITVGQATPSISWPNPGAITYGTALTAAQLDASASFVVGGGIVQVPGTFAYAQALGTALSAGADQMLTATFTPADSVDYTTAPASALISVAAAALRVSTVPVTMTAGQALPGFTAKYEGFVLGQGPSVLSGTLSFQTDATASSSPGTYSVIPSGLVDPNYAITYVPGTLTVLAAPVVVVTQLPPPVVVAPVVVQSLAWETEKVTRKKSIKVLVVDFSGPLNPGDAQDLAAYSLDLGKRKKRVGVVYTKSVPVRSVIYSSQNDSVTITPRGKVKNKTMQFTINAGLVLDASGRELDGNRDGVPGGNFVALLNGRSVISFAITDE